MADLLRHRIRRGAYHDSIVLMQLRVALAGLPGITEAGAVMGLGGNLEILGQAGLLPDELGALAADDLLVVVRASREAEAEAALDRIDELLVRRGSEVQPELRPRSLATAVREAPDARWVLVSVPGRWAFEVAREVLDRDRNVFLFSDHVPVEEEVALKHQAAERGLLVMGPDCGTALVAGIGFGFANRVRRGPIGLVAASGTGLQTVACRLHALGTGISHALGTGGRDLTGPVGGATALQAIDLLGRDPQTEVLVLISKPAAPAVTARVLAALQATGKPAVVCLLGRALPFRRWAGLSFAASLAETAELAAERVPTTWETGSPVNPTTDREGNAASRGGVLRGLFSGGTLAQEALEGWTVLFGPVTSNLKVPGSLPWQPSAAVSGHLLLDLGDDVFTAGRPHPMLDPAAVAERLEHESRDPAVAAVLCDLVLGDGAHPDPASVLGAAIESARAARPELEIVVLLVGTDEDPQDLAEQSDRLEAAGAWVTRDLGAAQERLWRLTAPEPKPPSLPVPLSALETPRSVINIGVETMYRSLTAQGVDTMDIEWRPPAGGDPRLASLLSKMRARS